jgi:hypothetical protein
MIPGFHILKDRVIKPLIVATEKVVEHYYKKEGGTRLAAGPSDAINQPLFPADEEMGQSRVA